MAIKIFDMQINGDAVSFDNVDETILAESSGKLVEKCIMNNVNLFQNVHGTIPSQMKIKVTIECI